MTTKPIGSHKSDRVYELHAKGVSNEAIAERLRINPKAVSTMIKQGRERKELAK